MSRSSELVHLVQKELETEETKSYDLFKIVNVEVAEFRQPKEELNSVTIKSIRDIYSLHSNVDGLWAKKISC